MVPKTLIFAKNDEHAEEIVEAVRDAFGRGNDFCAKITHKARKPHELLAAFRNSSQLRIAVTVDMIATGTDVKALECLIFMRDVRSWAYFEQMKGRGARTLSQTEFQSVTPDLLEKTRFVIVDAIGVTENPKVDAAPLDRDPTQRQSLEKLLRKVAAGECSGDDVSRSDPGSRASTRTWTTALRTGKNSSASPGSRCTAIARRLIDAVSGRRPGGTPRSDGGEPAVQALLDKALEPLASNPDLRKRILEIRRAVDILYDTYNTDHLLEAGPVATAPRLRLWSQAGASTWKRTATRSRPGTRHIRNEVRSPARCSPQLEGDRRTDQTATTSLDPRRAVACIRSALASPSRTGKYGTACRTWFRSSASSSAWMIGRARTSR